MSITIKQLRVFVSTAKTGQVSLAAEQCHITQSATSMALSQFESLMRTPVFERIGKRLVLNDTGKYLVGKAEEILQRVDEFEMLGQANTLAGTLSIAASKTTGTYLLPSLMISFLNKYPKVNVNYIIENSETVIEKVLHGEVDLGFIEVEASHPKLNVHPIKEDELLILADKHHPLAKKAKVSLKELTEYPWILREQGSGTRKIFEAHAEQFFNKLNILIELNEPEAIKKILLGSEILSCLSEEIVTEEIIKKQLVALNIENLTLKRKFNMIALTKRYETLLFKTFSKFIEEHSTPDSLID